MNHDFGLLWAEKKEKYKMRKRKVVNPAFGWGLLILVLALILLSIFKPELCWL